MTKLNALLRRFYKNIGETIKENWLLIITLTIPMIILMFIAFFWRFGLVKNEFFIVTDTNTQVSPIRPVSPLGVDIPIKVETWRTGWDLLELLGVIAVPAAVAVGVWWLNRQQQEQAQQLAKDHEEERALQSYLDVMTNLLLKENLRNSEKGAEVRSVARARTLTVLREVNRTRKTFVMKFLSEAELIGGKKILEPGGQEIEDGRRRSISIVERIWAYLSGDNRLKGQKIEVDSNIISLSEADLRGAKLSGAKYNSGTRWPEGFAPKVVGAINADEEIE